MVGLSQSRERDKDAKPDDSEPAKPAAGVWTFRKNTRAFAKAFSKRLLNQYGPA